MVSCEINIIEFKIKKIALYREISPDYCELSDKITILYIGFQKYIITDKIARILNILLIQKRHS